MTISNSKQLNEAFLVRRKLSIPDIKGKDSDRAIRESLSGINGVQAITVDAEHKIAWVIYDSSHIGFGEIEQLLNDCGHPISDSWWSRKKSEWYRYLDENARANAQHKPVCCSNPKDILAKRNK